MGPNAPAPGSQLALPATGPALLPSKDGAPQSLAPNALALPAAGGGASAGGSALESKADGNKVFMLPRYLSPQGVTLMNPMLYI